MKIIEIIEIGLKTKGYDGLYVGECCACEIGDLSPGNCLDDRCTPGYKHVHSENENWIIHKLKSPVSDDEIEGIINGTS